MKANKGDCIPLTPRTAFIPAINGGVFFGVLITYSPCDVVNQAVRTGSPLL